MVKGREEIDESIGRGPGAKGDRAIPGLDVLDERLLRHPGVHAYDPLRLAIDVPGTGPPARARRHAPREPDINLELCGAHMLVAMFG